MKARDVITGGCKSNDPNSVSNTLVSVTFANTNFGIMRYTHQSVLVLNRRDTRKISENLEKHPWYSSCRIED